MKVYRPREELRPYVRYYWVLESDDPFSVLTFPIGCPQIIFHKKTPLYIPELDISQSQFTISGQVNFPAHIQSDGGLEMIVGGFIAASCQQEYKNYNEMIKILHIINCRYLLLQMQIYHFFSKTQIMKMVISSEMNEL